MTLVPPRRRQDLTVEALVEIANAPSIHRESGAGPLPVHSPSDIDHIIDGSATATPLATRPVCCDTIIRTVNKIVGSVQFLTSTR